MWRQSLASRWRLNRQRRPCRRWSSWTPGEVRRAPPRASGALLRNPEPRPLCSQRKLDERVKGSSHDRRVGRVWDLCLIADCHSGADGLKRDFHRVDQRQQLKGNGDRNSRQPVRRIRPLASRRHIRPQSRRDRRSARRPERGQNSLGFSWRLGSVLSEPFSFELYLQFTHRESVGEYEMHAPGLTLCGPLRRMMATRLSCGHFA